MNKHAQKLGSLGGEARAKALENNPEKLKMIASSGGRALWQDHNPNQPCTCKGCKTRARKETR